MTDAGRSEFQPLDSNDYANGKAANRRTRIVILPQLDQFFKLLEHPNKLISSKWKSLKNSYQHSHSHLQAQF